MTTYWQPTSRFDGVIDVSHHNGVIDWGMVASGGTALAFVKATQGADYRDPAFATNRSGANAASILTIPYHFLTEDPVEDQLRNLSGVLGILSGPVMLDWEIDPQTNRRPAVAIMEAAGAQLRSLVGRDPLAYHGMYDLSSPAINAWPWMVPKYGPQPQGPHWLFWQFTDRAAVPGIAGGADRSYFAGTLDELRAWHRDGTMPASFTSPAASQPVSPVSNLKEGAGVLQHALQVNGLYSGPIDGVVGRNTLRALAKADPVAKAALADYRRGAWEV